MFKKRKRYGINDFCSRAKKFGSPQVAIAQTEDEQLIELWEDIIFDSPKVGDEVSDEEIALVEARIAEFRANPDDFVTLEGFAKQIKQNK